MVLLGAVAIALTAALTVSTGAAAKPKPRGSQGNLIQRENARRGTRTWENTFAPIGTIEGYTSEVSVLPGQTLHFHISLRPASRYRIEIYRLGYYAGAGGRLMGCLPSCASDKPGLSRPVPAPDPTTGLVEAGWPVTDVVRVPSNWLSGLYVGRVVATSGPLARRASAVNFVVRAPSSRNSTILVNLPFTTKEAYNSWGGKSLYTFGSSEHIAATQVSFDRPSATTGNAYKYEYTLLRYLEQQGYDVSYSTDVDVDLNPTDLLHHRLVLVDGHAEYWTKTIRDAFDSARNSGVNLAFFGGDIANWQIRFENGDRTVVEYRDGFRDPSPDPMTKTTNFARLVPPRPECELIGQGFMTGPPTTTLSINPASLGDRWMAGTGFKAGSSVASYVGEGEGVVPGCNTPPLTVFWAGPNPPDIPPGPPAYAAATRYTAPSGALVFSAGSFIFSSNVLTGNYEAWPPSSRGADPRMQRFFKNAMADLTRPR